VGVWLNAPPYVLVAPAVGGPEPSRRPAEDVSGSEALLQMLPMPSLWVVVRSCVSWAAFLGLPSGTIMEGEGDPVRYLYSTYMYMCVLYLLYLPSSTGQDW